MQRSILVIVPLVDANPCGDEQYAVFELIGLGSDVERGFSEVGECVDVDARVVDESADDLYGGVHGGVVDGRPVALVAVVDVDGQLRYLLLQVLDEQQRVVLENRLQEVIVQLVVFLPALLPDRLVR
jgi:hypothetical protein